MRRETGSRRQKSTFRSSSALPKSPNDWQVIVAVAVDSHGGLYPFDRQQLSSSNFKLTQGLRLRFLRMRRQEPAALDSWLGRGVPAPSLESRSSAISEPSRLHRRRATRVHDDLELPLPTCTDGLPKALSDDLFVLGWWEAALQHGRQLGLVKF